MPKLGLGNTIINKNNAKKLLPYQVEGNVLSLIANKSNAGYPPSSVPSTSPLVWKDLSKSRTTYQYSNFLTNGNYNNSTDVLCNTDNSSLSVSNNVVTVSPINSNGFTSYGHDTTTATGKSYYVKARLKHTDVGKTIKFLTRVNNVILGGASASNVPIVGTTSLEYKDYSTILITTAVGECIEINIAGTSNINSKAYGSQIMCVDLTALGLQNLSVEQCDALFPFTASTSPSTATSNPMSNDCLMVNQAGTSASGWNKTPVVSNKGISVSYTNLVTNGDFSGGTNDWSVDRATLSVLGNTLSVTGNGTGGNPHAKQDVVYTTSNRYYTRVRMRVTNSSCDTIRFTFGTTQVSYVASPTINQWYSIGYITTSATNTLLGLYHYYPDSATANGKVMEVEKVMSVNLTNNTQVQALETALGRQLTTDECDKLFAFTATSNTITVDTPYVNTLDGIDDYGSIVNTPSLDVTTNEICIAKTFKIAIGETTSWLLNKSEDAENETQYGLKYNSINGNIELWLQGVSRATTNASSISQNVWYNVIFYRNSSGDISSYVNGVVQTGASYVGALTSRPNLRLGGRSSNVGGTTHTDYAQCNVASENIYSSSNLNINKIIKAETNISKAYTGVS